MGKFELITVEYAKDRIFDKEFDKLSPIEKYIRQELSTVDARFVCEVDLKTRNIWVYESDEETFVGSIGKSGWSQNEWEVRGDRKKLENLAKYIFLHY